MKNTKNLTPVVYNEKNKLSTRREFYNYIVKKSYYTYIRKELAKYFQHGNTTILKHCRNVAYFSFVIAKYLEKKFKVSFDYEALIIGGFLHDFFMYDWHVKDKAHRLHGFSHPKVASKHAKELCNASLKQQAIIETHMWPLTITKIPKSREAILVCLCDKYSAILETIFDRIKA